MNKRVDSQIGNNNKHKVDSTIKWSSRIDLIKNIFVIIQTIGIIIVSISAYFFFNPVSANISHHIIDKQINDNFTWLNLSVNLSNDGKRPIIIRSGIIRVHGILPLDKNIKNILKSGEDLVLKDGESISWPKIAGYENLILNSKIYPGSNHYFNYDFIIPSYMRTIMIFTYYGTGKDSGWSKATIYDLKKIRAESNR